MNAKKRLFSMMVAGLVAAAASALQLQSDWPNSYGPYQVGNGGEFTLAIVSGTLDLSGYSLLTKNLGDHDPNFQSFCLEHNEYIYAHEKMNSYVSPAAILGGTPSADTLSQGAGWLYQQFARGILSGYNYTGSRLDSAALLQNALWTLEGEDTSATVANNLFYAAAVSYFGSEQLAQADGAISYGVYALNNYGADGTRRQDMIYYDSTISQNLVPSGSNHRVPDGGLTLALLGIALSGLTLLQRRSHS